MQVIVYSTGAVGCAVVTPAPGQDIDIVAARDIPEGTTFVILDAGALPATAPSATWKLADGKIAVDAAALAESLVTLKSALKARVDAAAEALRLTLITPGSGQAMEYQETYAEAVAIDAAVKAGQTPAAAAYPMLSASIGLDTDPSTGQPTVDLAGEARAVLAAYDAYQQAGAAIRRVRLVGKAAIDAATDAASAQATLNAIAWPKLG